MQDQHTAAIVYNQKVNVDAWSLFPWKVSAVDVYGQVLRVDSATYVANRSGTFFQNHAVYVSGSNVVWSSKLWLSASQDAAALPGLKCTGGYVYWSAAYTTVDHVRDIWRYQLLFRFSCVRCSI